MRFMLLVKAGRDSEAGVVADAHALPGGDRFNRELSSAGVLLASEQLHPSARGWRVRCSGGRRRMVTGPFPAGSGPIAAFWLLQAGSAEEALEWARRCPMAEGAEIEIRQVMDGNPPLPSHPANRSTPDA